MQLTDYLKDLRKVHGYKQDFVADYLGISRQTYSAYETGRIQPPTASLKRLSLLYSVSVDSFIEKMDLNCDDMILLSGNAGSVLVEQNKRNSDHTMKAFLEFTAARKESFKTLKFSEKWLLFYFSNMNSTVRNELMNFLEYRYAIDADHPKPPKL